MSRKNRKIDDSARAHELPDLPSETFICPISQTLMKNPVIAVDGHSYDEKHITAWFETAGTGSDPTSPITGEILPSRDLIPNHALRGAIMEYYQQLPEHIRRHVDEAAEERVPIPSSSSAQGGGAACHIAGGGGSSKTSQYTLTTPASSRPILHGTVLEVPDTVACVLTWEWCCCGPKVEAVNNDKVLRRIEDGQTFSEVTALGSRALRLYADEPMIFSVKIQRTDLAWGGMTIGLIANDKQGRLSSVEGEIESSGWYLDGDRWFHTQNDRDNELVSLATGNLQVDDIISFKVSDNGSVSFFVNGEKKVCLGNAKVPVDQALYPFVSLLGSTAEVSLDCQHPPGVLERE